MTGGGGGIWLAEGGGHMTGRGWHMTGRGRAYNWRRGDI